MFLGIYDPYKKKPARQKLLDALDRYQEKHGHPARFCLTSPQDAAELAEATKKHPGEPPVQVQARGYIARHTFYVGTEEASTA